MSEILMEGVIVDSNLTLEEALGLPQLIDPPKEVLETLGIVNVTYFSSDGKLHQGQVVLRKDLLDDLKGAFDLITKIKFPVASVIPMGSKLSDEEKDVAMQNTCGFNYRLKAGGIELSNHSLGTALDINPTQNPFIRGDLTVPPDAKYIPGVPGTITEDGKLVKYFKEHGWEWGGDWIDRKDYMHFEKPLSK